MDTHTVDRRARSARRFAHRATIAAWAFSIPVTIFGTLAWAPKATFDDWWFNAILLSMVLFPQGIAAGLPHHRPLRLPDIALTAAAIVLILLVLAGYANVVVTWAEAAGAGLGDGAGRLELAVMVAVPPGGGAWAAGLLARDRWRQAVGDDE
ncbi:hypothetical protein [Micromonospora costi]|uniref:Uncharacterized protein n=1 Tax=Micromonospora costi TaxID=1530042 RepID=A0A3B0A709_9ACTN|nr:hypothetical protein [Micromonospora costi]RKN55984.1 hypothetical protein D7193_15480 [Micromonospora costi]